MANDTATTSASGSREKMAEGDKNAEKLKEKANNCFKGKYDNPVKSVLD